jgi:uncharacterized membrane protein
MAKKNLTLIAAEYKNLSRAETIRDMIQEMKKARTIRIADATVVTKTADGKLKVEETSELTTRKGTRRGAIILGTIGLIFPPSFVASILVGGGVGALAGKLRDTGIKTDDFERFANSLPEDHAAVIVLAYDDSVSRITKALEGYEGMIITQEIDIDAASSVMETAGEPGTEEVVTEETPPSTQEPGDVTIPG